MTSIQGRSRHVRGLLARSGAACILSLVALALPLSAVAHAHAERIGSTPEEGERLQEAPQKISIEFSEPPTGDSNLEVVDGCGDDVVEEVRVANQQVSASLAEGQPGRWKVRSSVVSGLDGHPKKDSWEFTVAGEKDCSQGGGGDQTAPREREDDDSSFPVIPVAIGTVALVAVAVLVRVLMARSSD